MSEGVSRQRRRQSGEVFAFVPRQEGAVAHVAIDAVLPNGARAELHLLALRWGWGGGMSIQVNRG